MNSASRVSPLDSYWICCQVGVSPDCSSNSNSISDSLGSLYAISAEAASLATPCGMRCSRPPVPVTGSAPSPRRRVDGVSPSPRRLSLSSSISDGGSAAPMPAVSSGCEGVSSHVTTSACANVNFVVLTIGSVAVSSPPVESTSIALPAQLASGSHTSRVIYTHTAAMVFGPLWAVVPCSFCCSVGSKSSLLSAPFAS